MSPIIQWFLKLFASRHLFILSLVLVFSGCQQQQMTQNKSIITVAADDRHSVDAIQPVNAVQSVKAGYYHVDIPTFDGTLLRATVFQPNLDRGQTAPLIIHSHSFSTFRMSKPLSLYGTIMFAGKTALQLWRQGYWVISFDQRGHGESGGQINLMSADYEVRDASSVIDWAEAHLPRMTQHAEGSAIGMLGESYTGSLQLLASTQDARIDAIVPIHTWYDLSQSLYPQGVAKGWLTTLIVAGNLLNYGRVNSVINDGYLHTFRKGGTTDAFAENLEARSLKTFCDQGQLPQADALVFQGFQDTLFGIDQGIQIRNCFLKAGKDVRFIGTQKGHMLPMVQQDGLMPIHNVDKNIRCGKHQYSSSQMIVDWFDEKLKQQSNAAGYIPQVCLTVDPQQGLTMTDIPVGGRRFSFSPVSIHGNYAGLLEWLLKPSGTVLRGLNIQEAENKTAWLRPAFMPLMTVEKAQYLLGVPLLDADVSKPDEAKEPTVFVGLARMHGHSIELISKQVTPLLGAGKHKIVLGGVSAALKPGDQVGVIIYSYSSQYRMARSGFLTQAKIKGVIELPLINLPDQKINTILAAPPKTPFKTWQDLPGFFQPLPALNIAHDVSH